MEKLTIADIKDLTEYEKTREAFRKRIIDLKARRRVEVGPRVTLVFENRETALSQVQEMVRAERMVKEEQIQHEIDTWNELIPERGELSATLFIEITDAADIRKELDGFLGLDKPGAVYLEIEGEGRAVAQFEAGHSTEQRISAVHYVRFRLTPGQAHALIEGRAPVTLVIDHPRYRERAVIEGEIRKSLASDLAV